MSHPPKKNPTADIILDGERLHAFPSKTGAIGFSWHALSSLLLNTVLKVPASVIRQVNKIKEREVTKCPYLQIKWSSTYVLGNLKWNLLELRNDFSRLQSVRYIQKSFMFSIIAMSIWTPELKTQPHLQSFKLDEAFNLSICLWLYLLRQGLAMLPRLVLK
jgi:hypothetical protein